MSMRDWDARIYRTHTGFVSDLGRPVVDLLAPRPGESILDLGCGDGVLTAGLAELGCDVVGIDASPEMVAAARERGVDARLLDAAALASTERFFGRFDAVFSNAALHWMHPLHTVARGVVRALKPTGRFVAELGGKGNIDRLRAGLYGALESRGVSREKIEEEIDPWHFPSPEEYAAILEGLGLEIETLEHFDRPTELPAGIAAWVESVGRPFLQAVPPQAQRDFLADVEDRLAGVLRREDGAWWADYVRLRVRAVRNPAA